IEPERGPRRSGVRTGAGPSTDRGWGPATARRTRPRPQPRPATLPRMAEIQAVLFDYGHTLVDFHRTEEALLEAYEQIRARIEAALYMEAPEVGHLIDRVANEIDRRVGASYEEKRLEELDLVKLFDEVLLATLGLTVPPDVVEHIVHLDHSAYSRTIRISGHNLDVLNELKGRGLKLGLVSNVALLPALMRTDLEDLGIAPLLD